jgi:hypothetical protein
MRASIPALVLALATMSAQADEITDQLDQARQLYEAGDVAGAIGELEFAMQALKGRIAEDYRATFPPPAAGWTAQDAAPGEQAAALPFLGGGAMLQRTYQQTNGAGRIEAQLMTGGSFLQGLAGMMMNPAMLAAQPNAKRVRIGRENAVLIFDSQTHEAQLVLDLGGKATIMLQGSNLESGDPVTDLAQRWDLKKVRELAGL